MPPSLMDEIFGTPELVEKSISARPRSPRMVRARVVPACARVWRIFTSTRFWKFLFVLMRSTNDDLSTMFVYEGASMS
jgi:hypothetical protein